MKGYCGIMLILTWKHKGNHWLTPSALLHRYFLSKIHLKLKPPTVPLLSLSLQSSFQDQFILLS